MSEEKDIEEVLSKDEMYPIWFELCPDPKRYKEELREAFKRGSNVDTLNDYGNSVFEAWYSERFNDTLTTK